MVAKWRLGVKPPVLKSIFAFRVTHLQFLRSRVLLLLRVFAFQVRKDEDEYWGLRR